MAIADGYFDFDVDEFDLDGLVYDYGLEELSIPAGITFIIRAQPLACAAPVPSVMRRHVVTSTPGIRQPGDAQAPSGPVP